jgi:hypothetical protein
MKGMKKKKFSLINDRDVMMVLDPLGFIFQRQGKYLYLKNQIANEGLRKPYEELKKGIAILATKLLLLLLEK